MTVQREQIYIFFNDFLNACRNFSNEFSVICCRRLSFARLTADTSRADSDMVMDFDRGNSRRQDCESGFCTDCLQTLLFPPYKSKQVDRAFAFPFCSYCVLVRCPLGICCRYCIIRRHSGRTLYLDTSQSIFLNFRKVF